MRVKPLDQQETCSIVESEAWSHLMDSGSWHRHCLLTTSRTVSGRRTECSGTCIFAEEPPTANQGRTLTATGTVMSITGLYYGVETVRSRCDALKVQKSGGSKRCM